MGYFFKKKLKEKYYLYAGKSKSEGQGNAIRTESKYIGPYDALCLLSISKYSISVQKN